MTKAYFTDGEGPLVFKDLAQDLVGRTPPGKDFFGVLSFYDDYLAEVGTQGYQAGDTLALAVPHLLHHGITDEVVREEARDARVVKGVEQFISGLVRDGFDVRIISTAYRPLWDFIGGHLGIPRENIACTELELDSLKDVVSDRFHSLVEKTEQEVKALMPQVAKAQELVDNGVPIVEAVGDGSSYKDFREILDQFYWRDLDNQFGYKTLKMVKVMGGRRKIEAANSFAANLGVSLDRVAYTGDSITDDALHKTLSEEGGLPIAVNGNMYALRNARVAVATVDMQALRPVVDHWQEGGFEGVFKFVESTKNTIRRSKEGAAFTEGNNDAQYDIIHLQQQGEFMRVLSVHKEYRKAVRGGAARLG